MTVQSAAGLQLLMQSWRCKHRGMHPAEHGLSTEHLPARLCATAQAPSCAPARRFKAGLVRLEELVRKIVDLLANRVESNLKGIANTLLVELPSDRSAAACPLRAEHLLSTPSQKITDVKLTPACTSGMQLLPVACPHVPTCLPAFSHRSFTYDEFVSTQARFQKRQAEVLAVRNEEVRRSIEDLVALAQAHPRENPEESVKEDDIVLLKSYFSGEMYNVGAPAAADLLAWRTALDAAVISNSWTTCSVNLGVTCTITPSLHQHDQCACVHVLTTATHRPTGHPVLHPHHLHLHEASAGVQDRHRHLLYGAPLL